MEKNKNYRNEKKKEVKSYMMTRARNLAHAVQFFKRKKYEGCTVYTKCTSQHCCQVAEFTALFQECEGILLAVNRELRSF